MTFQGWCKNVQGRCKTIDVRGSATSPHLPAFSQDPKRGRPILVTSTVRGGGGGGFEKTSLWKTFEVYVTSYQYLFQARSKFFKHTFLCEY
jgi:hypothetical protein